MLPLAIVKHLNVFEAGRPHFSLGSVTQAMVAFVLETVEPALGRRVVPAISLAAHRTRHAERAQLVLVGLTGVLGAIRMMQRVCHQLRRHARLERPADHFPIEQIQNDGKVKPAFIGPQVGDVCRPNLIRRRRREVAVKQISRHWQTVLRFGRTLVGGTSGVRG